MAKETKIELEIPQGRKAFPAEQADAAERGFERKGKDADKKGQPSKAENKKK